MFNTWGGIDLYKLINGMDFDKMESILKRNFNTCKEILNSNLVNILKQKPLDIDFKLSLNNKLEVVENSIKDTREIEFSPKVTKQLEAFYTHILNKENENYYRSITNGDEYNEEKANKYRSLLFEISIRFLMLHEFGHIYNGHLLFLSNEKIEDEEVNMTRKVFEWNADDFATTQIVAMYCSEETVQSLNKELGGFIINLDHIFLLLIEATVISISMMNLGLKNRQRDNEHIELRQRLVHVLNNEVSVFNRLNKKEMSVSNEFLLLAIKIENLVNDFLNKVESSGQWDIKNNLNELSEESLNEIKKIEEYYIKNIQHLLKKYSRYEALMKEEEQ